MAGSRLEVFKFGVYVMFPIAMMYYFGVNLEQRFSVPNFWPPEERTNRIPFEREEIKAELEKFKREAAERRKKKQGQVEQGGA